MIAALMLASLAFSVAPADSSRDMLMGRWANEHPVHEEPDLSAPVDYWWELDASGAFATVHSGNTEKGTWALGNECQGVAAGPEDAGMLRIDWTRDSFTACYYVMTLTEDRLTLMFVSRGSLLTFRKMRQE